MSKLADLIRQTTRIEGRRLGFGSGSAKKQPSLALAAIVPERWGQSVSEAAAAGADVFLLTGRPSDSDVRDAIAKSQDRPCGLAAPEADGDRLKKFHDAGIDFVVLDTTAPASALNHEKLGFVLQARDDLTDIQLRTLESLQLDALYLDTSPSPLTIARLMDLRRVSGLARKPLLLSARPDAQEDDLITLRDSGVSLIAVDMKEKGAADALKRLRGVIDGLPERRKHRDQANEAMLPHAAVAQGDDDEDDD
jgi:hypothetical protein